VRPGRQRDKKKRKGDGGRGLPRGKRLAGCWTTGPKGKRSKLFSFFLFQTLFKTTFQIQIQIKSFKTFHKIFINILEFTQATKTHTKPKK
jgi:hypothetical protein